MRNLSSRINLLKDAIVMEEGAVRAQKFLALAVFCAGLVAAVLVHVLSGDALGESPKWILSICGPLISTGGAGFPLKEIYCRRYKVHRLRFLKDEYERFQQNPAAAEVESVPLAEMHEFLNFVEKS